jgi:hypothetical protein
MYKKLYLSLKMNFPWEELDRLIDQVGAQLMHIEAYRNDLEHAKISTLQKIYLKEHCQTCQGYCSPQKTKIDHLRILGKHAESVAMNLTDLIETKLHYRNLCPTASFSSSSPPPNFPEPRESPAAVSSPRQE